jgi:hypothetical protein
MIKPQETKQKHVSTFEILSLDVWGNEQDGFDVNNIFSTGIKLKLKENCSDKDICKALKTAGYLKKGIRTKSLSIDGDFDYNLYIDEAKNGRPFCHLRNMKEGN